MEIVFRFTQTQFVRPPRKIAGNKIEMMLNFDRGNIVPIIIGKVGDKYTWYDAEDPRGARGPYDIEHIAWEYELSPECVKQIKAALG